VISTAPAPLSADAQSTSNEGAAKTRDDVASFLAAGASIKEILSQIAKQPAPASADPSGDGTEPLKPPEQEGTRK